MSTSSVRTVKRWASSLARSSTSPTSRPSRSASSATVSSDASIDSGSVDDALAQRGDVAADRRQRRPQLVRDGHEEVALALLRLGEPGGHLAEAVGEVADLAAAGDARHLDVVVALRDLVGRVGEGEHRPGDPAREVEGERAHDHEREEERDREAREQRHPGVAQLRLRLGDDQVPEHRPAARPDRVRRREERPVLPRRPELEGDDPLRREVDADVPERDPGQAGVLARRETTRRRSRAGLRSPPRAWPPRRSGAAFSSSTARTADSAYSCASPRASRRSSFNDGVARVVLEEAQRDQARDEPGERDPRQEERRQAKAQGVEH